MNCAHVKPLLDAYIDNELDAQTSAGITQHLTQCAACSGAHAAHDELRMHVRAHAPYHNAPDSLRAQIEAFDGRDAPAAVATRRKPPGWLVACVLACCTALVGLVAGFLLARPAADDPLREQVAASHVASLAANGRLLDVTASDQHVVKPWFQGKIDFAPVVRDLSAEGFKLAGARLDHVGERQAAAVVYRIRNHVINVFVWRTANLDALAPSASAARGYSVIAWAHGGLQYTAISDVDARDLRRLAALMSGAP